MWAKVEFARRLGDDWRDLADALAVPEYVQRTFDRGFEGQAIWALVERQNQTNALPLALRAIGRSDLAELVASASDGHLPGSAESTSPPAPRGVGTYQPPRPTAAFTGRTDELRRIRRRFERRSRTNAIALCGPGGVGKTQLALEYVRLFVDDHDIAWWINAEQTSLLPEQLAVLGQELGLVPCGADAGVAVRALFAHLRKRPRWLIVFDDASNSRQVVDWMPSGSGHVLITSRSRSWTDVAHTISIDTLRRAESVAMLRKFTSGSISDPEMNDLAEQLGDLPLALAQAGGVMAETGMPPAEYQQALTSTAGAVLSTGTPTGYPRSLAATVRLAFGQLAAADPPVARLVQLCAALGPEPIPLNIFTVGADRLAEPLGDLAANAFELRRHVGRAASYGLIHVNADSITMHRLTQRVIRDDMVITQSEAVKATAEALLVRAQPPDSADPTSWPQWSQLLPHILALNPSDTDNDAMRHLACAAVWYLHARGDARTALPLAESLFNRWTERLGKIDPLTLTAGSNVAWIYRVLSRYDDARRLNENILALRKDLLGADHPDTLRSASNLAADLRRSGHAARARDLDEDTLQRRHRLLGDTHVDTLRSASNLGIDLRVLGLLVQARELDHQTYQRCRQALGEDNPDTLNAANNLAFDLRELGLVEQARQLDTEILARRQALLGEDHHETLRSASNLATDLWLLGQAEEARQLQEAAFERCRRLLGDNHHDTLRFAINLAAVLHAVDEHDQAHTLNSETLARCQAVLGHDHPDTQRVRAAIAVAE